jgi:hypothetical protein
VVSVEVVVVVVMEVCVTVNWMQYKFLSKCPSNKLLLVGTALARGLDKWNAYYCSDVKL